MKRSRFSEEQIIAILKGAGEWLADEGCVPPARHQLGDILQVEG